MTNEDRQTVIDALELLQEYMHAYNWRDVADYENAQAALAIMRREREPVAFQWLDTSHFRKKLPITAERSHWNPLYKD